MFVTVEMPSAFSSTNSELEQTLPFDVIGPHVHAAHNTAAGAPSEKLEKTLRLARPLCSLKQGPQHRRKQALEITKLSHPSHDVWRWRTTMYVKSVNLVFLVLMPIDLLLSLRQCNVGCFHSLLSLSCLLNGLFGRTLQRLPRRHL